MTLAQRRHVVRKLARREATTNGGRPAPALLARGFLSAKRALYPFGEHPRAAFLTDWEIEMRLLRVNAPGAADAYTDKAAVHRMAAEGALPVRMPTLLGEVRDGERVWGDWAGEDAIAKPCRGSGGRGVVRLEPGDAPPPRGHYVVERAVRAAAPLAHVFPGALPTVRVLTARDEGGAFVLGAAHRFGTRASAPTDNFKRGGVVAGIELGTGALGPAVAYPDGLARRETSAHPETGERVEGVVVPGWDTLIAQALAAAEACADLTYAGWDFAATDDGPVLIEVNAALPNPNIVQASRPMLADARARRFFEAAGVITGRRARAAARAVS